MNPHELFTLREAAAILKISYRRARNWADTGRLEVRQNGRQSLRLVPASELVRLQEANWFIDWAAVEEPERQNRQNRPAGEASPYPDSMTTAKLTTSEAFQRRTQLKKQLSDNRSALKAARWAARTAHPTDLGEAKQVESARQAVVQARAAVRAGFADQSAIAQAEKHLHAVTEGIRLQRNAARDEVSILEAERQLLEDELTRVTTILEGETAEALRPTVGKWLEKLSAFLEANDELHELETTLTTAGIPPAVTAARELTITTADARQTILAMLARQRSWSTYYGAEVEQHPSLASRTHLLKREHEAAAKAHAARIERAAKTAASVKEATAKSSNPLGRLGIGRRRTTAEKRP